VVSRSTGAAAADAPFLARLSAGARPVVSGFPSTTATASTSLGTGVPAGAHGIVGYCFTPLGGEPRVRYLYTEPGATTAVRAAWTALLLDLANIVGGFLLAASLLVRSPRIGGNLARADGVIAPFGWIVGIVALVAGGYYLIVHAISGPHVFHFEIVGIGVGLALLWDRITGRPPVHHPAGRTPGLGRTTTATVTGTGLLLAVFGIIAIVVGLQGLVTPN